MKAYFLKIASACLVSCTVFSAFADRPLMPAKVLPAYQAECASCHMAYPPALLSKPAWQKIMSGLDKHYGTDASLDGPTQKQIGVWLQAQGGTYKRVETSSTEERITTTQWFEKNIAASIKTYGFENPSKEKPSAKPATPAQTLAILKTTVFAFRSKQRTI